MKAEEIYRTLIKIVKPHNGYTAQLEAIARWVESDFEPKLKGQELPIHNVSKSVNCDCEAFRIESKSAVDFCGKCGKSIL